MDDTQEIGFIDSGKVSLLLSVLQSAITKEKVQKGKERFMSVYDVTADGRLQIQEVLSSDTLGNGSQVMEEVCLCYRQQIPNTPSSCVKPCAPKPFNTGMKKLQNLSISTPAGIATSLWSEVKGSPPLLPTMQ